MDSKSRGYSAEDHAVGILKNRGYRIIKRNFYTPFSEIDIIAVDHDVLVLVEVKARWGSKYGKPEESVNAKKLEKIKRAGELYYLKHPNLPKKSRIEVVSLIFDGANIISEKLITVY